MIVNVRKNILIVGLGLLGGSYAKALKRFGFPVRAVTLEQEDIDYALRENIIDQGSTTASPRLLGEADLVIFALYPRDFVEWIQAYQGFLKPGALLTDVTGVKTGIVYKIQEILREDLEFIAAHPMAGREVSGVQNSTPQMFHGANYIITPTKKNTPEAIEACRELGHLLGFANVAELSPEEHDQTIGFLSQLTHCIAITLMTCNDKENLERFTGDSFRDLTRIAKINDRMWSELFLANKDALLEQMEKFSQQFSLLKTMLETEDVEGMRQMMRTSTQRRARFDKK